MNAAQRSDAYLIIKRGLYYKPKSQGYVGIRDLAGRFPLAEVATLFPNTDSPNQDGMTFVHEDDAPEFSEACWDDVKAKWLVQQRNEARIELTGCKIALEQAWASIRDRDASAAAREDEHGNAIYTIACQLNDFEDRYNADQEKLAEAEASIASLTAERGELIDARAVAEAVENGEGVGNWLSCTGCHELDEGHPTGRYSVGLKCYLGLGCTECGGIGAVWDTTDYGEMGDWLAKELIADADREASARTPQSDADLGALADVLESRGQNNSLHDIRRAAAALRARPVGVGLSQAALDVLAERQRQITTEGWTPEHDDSHDQAEMAAAAASYAFSAFIGTGYRAFAADPLGFWPWDAEWFKPSTPRRDLIKCGALILAEIERRDRAAQKVDAL